MENTTNAGHSITIENVHKAVRQNHLFSVDGLQERLFTFLFSGLVYPQIWEDPIIDMEALALTSEDRMIAIASGGCNILSYLTADPASVIAVDLNEHHIALNHLKLAGLKLLPDHQTFFDFFGVAHNTKNIQVYDTFLSGQLNQSTQEYWDTKNWRGKRRIEKFTTNIYKEGLLGKFIGTGHLLAKLFGWNLSKILEATTIDEQRAIFDSQMRPVLRSKLFKSIVSNRASLYGLGIPPAQYRSLLSSGAPESGMAGVLEQRLERLACGFPIQENYFAWQGFGRRYEGNKSRALPPYLSEGNYTKIKERADRVTIRHGNLIEVLERSVEKSLDCYVLLDAQDWMTDDMLNRLWRAIMRTARPGARVIFRTAAEESLLPGRLAPDILDRWHYDVERCKAWTLRDRSAIYGGFHLYTLQG